MDEQRANMLADAQQAVDDASDALAFWAERDLAQREQAFKRWQGALARWEDLQGLVSRAVDLALLATGSGPGGEGRPLGWAAHPGL